MAYQEKNYFVEVFHRSLNNCARRSYEKAVNREKMHTRDNGSYSDKALAADVKIAEMRYLESVLRNV